VQSNGSFRIMGLPPGRYTVQAWMNAGRINPVKDVEAGQDGVTLHFVPNK